MVKATAISMQPGVSEPMGENRWLGTVTRVQTEPAYIAVTAEVQAGRTVTAIIANQTTETGFVREHATVAIAIAPSSVTLVVPS